MANTFHCDKVQTVIPFGVARHLPISEPGSPSLFGSPVEALNPIFGSFGGHCAISVSRVLQNAVFVFEDGVNPNGGLVGFVILDLGGAFGPRLNFLGDVERLAHILSVHVVRDVLAQKRSLLVVRMFEPGGVFCGCVSPGVLLVFPSDKSHTKTVRILGRVQVVVGAVQVIPVELLGQRLNFEFRFDALGSLRSSKATQFFVLLPQLRRYDVKVGNSGRVGRCHSPFGLFECATVSNHESLHVDGSEFTVEIRSQVVLVDLPGQPGYVNSSVRLSAHIQVVVCKFGEFGVELVQCGQSIL